MRTSPAQPRHWAGPPVTRQRVAVVLAAAVAAATARVLPLRT